MLDKIDQIPEIPRDQSARVELVGVRIVDAERWHAGMAQRLGISRTTLYRYLTGKKLWMRGVDLKLMEVMAAERAASYRRARLIAALETKFASFMGWKP